MEANLATSVFNAPVFYLPLATGFLAFTNTWLETPLHTIDYWQLSVAWTDDPEHTQYDPLRHSFKWPITNLTLGSAAPITSIEIMSVEETYMDKTVVYDRAIVFHADHGPRFCFAAHANIADVV